MKVTVLKDDFPGYRAGDAIDLDLTNGRYHAPDGFWMDKSAFEECSFFRLDTDAAPKDQKFFYVDAVGRVQEILTSDDAIGPHKECGNLYSDEKRANLVSERVKTAYREEF